jgi:hypothetical protein
MLHGSYYFAMNKPNKCWNLMTLILSDKLINNSEKGLRRLKKVNINPVLN